MYNGLVFKFKFTPTDIYKPMHEPDYPVMYEDGQWYIFVTDAYIESGAQAALVEDLFADVEPVETTKIDKILITSLIAEAANPEYYGSTIH